MKKFLVLSMVLMLTSCSWYVHMRTDEQQGNILTPEKISLVRKGMSKREVAYILGNPVYHNLFDTNRWDYVYSRQLRSAHPTVKTVSYLFVNDRVSQIIS